MNGLDLEGSVQYQLSDSFLQYINVIGRVNLAIADHKTANIIRPYALHTITDTDSLNFGRSYFLSSTLFALHHLKVETALIRKKLHLPNDRQAMTIGTWPTLCPMRRFLAEMSDLDFFLLKRPFLWRVARMAFIPLLTDQETFPLISSRWRT